MQDMINGTLCFIRVGQRSIKRHHYTINLGSTRIWCTSRFSICWHISLNSMHSAITLILNGLSKNYLKPKRTTRFSRWWHLLPLFQLILFNLFVISNFKRITWQRVPENPGLHSHWYPLMRSVHFPPCMQGSLLHSSTFVSHSVPVYPGWQTQMNELIRSWVTIIMHVNGRNKHL